MRLRRISTICLFLLFLVLTGRLFGGVAFVGAGFFFLSCIVSLPSSLLVLLCFAIDLLFFLPFGTSIIVLSAAHLLFPFFKKGLLQMLLFFFLLYLVYAPFSPHLSLVKLAVILCFPILLSRIQIYQSKMYEVG